MGGEAIGIQRDFNLKRRRTGNLHARDAGQALEATLQGTFDQIIGRGQIVRVRGQAHAQHRIIGGGEFLHEITLKIVRQLVADGIDAITRLGRGDGDVAIPIGKLQKHAAAIGTRLRTHALDPRQRRQRFFHRPHQRAFDLLRRGTGVRQAHREEWRIDFGKLFQRQTQAGNRADHQQRDEEHHHRDRAAQAGFDNAHAVTPDAASSSSMARARAT